MSTRPAPSDDSPQLTPEVVESDELLGEAVDAMLDADSIASGRLAAIVLVQTLLRKHVDDEAWAILLRMDELITARSADALVETARLAFNACRRWPLPAPASGNGVGS